VADGTYQRKEKSSNEKVKSEDETEEFYAESEKPKVGYQYRQEFYKI
jgi:hypothetical protein